MCSESGGRHGAVDQATEGTARCLTPSCQWGKVCVCLCASVKGKQQSYKDPTGHFGWESAGWQAFVLCSWTLNNCNTQTMNSFSSMLFIPFHFLRPPDIHIAVPFTLSTLSHCPTLSHAPTHPSQPQRSDLTPTALFSLVAEVLRASRTGPCHWIIQGNPSESPPPLDVCV